MSNSNVGREPVSTTNMQLALQFLSGISSLLDRTSTNKVRYTLLRVMHRAGKSYLQQLCPYLPQNHYSHADIGRIFDSTDGITGEAYQTRMVLASKVSSKNEASLAVPILDRHGSPVLILFAQANQQGYFHNLDRIQLLSNACCDFVDFLNLVCEDDIYGIKNYPAEANKRIKADKRLNTDLFDKLDMDITALNVETFDFNTL